MMANTPQIKWVSNIPELWGYRPFYFIGQLMGFWFYFVDVKKVSNRFYCYCFNNVDVCQYSGTYIQLSAMCQEVMSSQKTDRLFLLLFLNKVVLRTLLKKYS